MLAKTSSASTAQAPLTLVACGDRSTESVHNLGLWEASSVLRLDLAAVQFMAARPFGNQIFRLRPLNLLTDDSPRESTEKVLVAQQQEWLI